MTDMRILPDELALVDGVLRRHPRASAYRLSAHDDRIEVYERATVDVRDMLAALGAADQAAAPAGEESRSGFVPVLRFVLVDAERRRFRAEQRERPAHAAWTALGDEAPLAELVRRVLPRLGSV